MKTYSEKEKLIFDGVLKLFRNGSDLSGIKTQQIADAAGIGKSTIYEYFDSKDNVISQTIIYALDMYIERLRQSIERELDFESKMLRVMNIQAENAMNMNMLFNTVSAFGSAENFKKQANDNRTRTEFIRIMAEMRQVYKDLLQLGQEEKVIDLSAGGEYVEQAFRSAMGGIMRADMCCQSTEHKEKSVRMAYTILVKSLN